MPNPKGIELTPNFTWDELRMINWALGQRSDAVAEMPQNVGLSVLEADAFWGAYDKLDTFFKMMLEVQP